MSKFAAVGHRFIVEPSGTAISLEESKKLKELQPYGVMFRTRNFVQEANYSGWLNTFKKLLDDFQNCVNREKIIVSIDHEGGRVHRFPKDVPNFPYVAQYSDSTEAVDLVATRMAQHLTAHGINVLFGPVADIHSNPKNNVINQRAFGTTPDMVADRAVRFANAIQKEGLVACAKHFPGHGDTTEDSHFKLPKIDLTLDELKKRELIPFKALIGANIPMIMTAHLLVPKVDEKRTATTSSKILQDLLRSELGFKGLVVADALGMEGISKELSDEDFVVAGDKAGLDLFLVVGPTVDIGTAVELGAKLERARSDGKIDRLKFEARHEQIEKFVNSLPQHKVTGLTDEIIERDTKLAESLSKNKEFQPFDFNPKGFM